MIHDGFNHMRGSVMNNFIHKYSFVSPISKNYAVSRHHRNVHYLITKNLIDKNFIFSNTQSVFLGPNEQVRQSKKFLIPLNPLISKSFPLVTF